jgi:hypothetical protein
MLQHGMSLHARYYRHGYPCVAIRGRPAGGGRVDSGTEPTLPFESDRLKRLIRDHSILLHSFMFAYICKLRGVLLPAGWRAVGGPRGVLADVTGSQMASPGLS